MCQCKQFVVKYSYIDISFYKVSEMSLLQISGQVRTNLRFFDSAICDKGFSSLAFAALLLTKT
jgi:hypothetical protein